MTEVSALSKLKPRQRKFVEAYVVSLNAAKAAREAGYSEKSARFIGNENLTKPDIVAAVAEAQAAMWKRLHMEQDEILAIVSEQARGVMQHIVHITPDGDPYIDLSKASAGNLSHLVELTIEDFTDSREVDDEGNTVVRSVRRVKAKTASVDTARTNMMRRHGLLKDTVKVELDEAFPRLMAERQAIAKAAREALVTDE